MSNLSLTRSNFSAHLGGAITKLQQVVFGGEDVWFLEEGELTLTRISKIQHLIKTFQKLYAHPEAANYPALSHLTTEDGTSSLLQVFITAILSDKEENPRDLAIYSLRCLEKVDPSFAPINHQIENLFGKHKPSIRAAYKTLVCLAKQQFPPLSLYIPIRPHQLIKHPSVYVSEPLHPLAYLNGQNMGQNHALHDKFWTLTHIALGNLDSLTYAFRQNLKDVGAQEGFHVRTWREKDFSYPWIRDVAIIKSTGEMLLPSRIRYQSSTSDIVRKLVNDPYVNVMDAIAEGQYTKKLSFLKKEICGVKEASFCFEGGNLIPAVDQMGRLWYLSGQDNILLSFLNAAITFRGLEDRLLEKMKCLQGTEYYAAEHVKFVHKRLKKTGFLDPFSPKEQESITKLTIAGFSLIQDMMERELGHPVLGLGHPLDGQVDFHLDMFLAPAPGGLIFMHDPDLCYELLKRILRTCALSKEEKDRLALYAEYAIEQRGWIAERLNGVEETLTRAGFKVCRVPGVFYEGMNEIAVHFLNAIFGKGKKGTFCISNGSPHPLDAHLRDAFTGYMKSYGIDHVYFTGRPSIGEVSSQGGLPYFPARESLRQFGGIHCRTQEFNLLFKDKEEDVVSEIDIEPFQDPPKIVESFPLFLKHMLGFLNQKP